jgi:Domain of unknown function (DUF3854)
MDQCYRTADSNTTPALSARHRRMLYDESGISPEVVAERGVRTVRSGRELPKGYSWRQRRRAPGILFTLRRPGGETSHVFRPDEPDPKNPGHKYEMPCKAYGAPGNVLDVHPRMRHLLDDLSEPLVFVEGVKKGDALASRGVAAVAISGVYNWLSGGEPIADMYEVPVEGRRVYVCFDSDMLRNPNVQDAAERLAEHLQSRGANAWIVYLHDQPDGSKTGADDFLAGGGTLEELLDLARPFDTEDVQREKLSRSGRLRRCLEDLARQHDEMPAKSQGECSERAAWRACLTTAERRGALVEDGVEIRISSRTGGELAAMGHMTFARRMNALVEAGRVRRVKGERSEHADSYVLLVAPRALLIHDGEGPRRRGETRRTGDGPHRGVSPARPPAAPSVPELRWSYVATVREEDERGFMREVYEYVSRPGKKRGEILRYLLDNGGSATIPELMERFAGPKTRPRDFKRRQLAELLGYRRQHKGRRLSVGPPIVEMSESPAGDVVRLAPDWAGALERRRELGGEQDAAVRQMRRHLLQRAAYRARGETKADRAPSQEEMDERREARASHRRVQHLVEQGMAREIATREVVGADGFFGDLRPDSADESEAATPRGTGPPDDPAEHPLSCDCARCAAPVTRYATPASPGSG